MHVSEIVQDLRAASGPTIVLLVLDGLGDVPTRAHGGKTPLEAAQTPNLDALAPDSSLGRLIPVAPGITPGSGPGHLGLFGYDPLEVQVGRGVIEALGLDLDVNPNMLCARANYATLDAKGVVTDRRAGRIPDEANAERCELLRAIGPIDGVNVHVTPGKSHRFVVRFEGDGLRGASVSDSDPGREGAQVREVVALTDDGASHRAAKIVNAFWREAQETLSGHEPANGVLMRGVGGLPEIPSFSRRFGLTAAAVASYPMYRGLAQLVGMTKIPTADGPEAEFTKWREVRSGYDFGFVHVKATDMHGEDGNFEGKAAAIEAVDRALPILLDTEPFVLAITGDHSTPVSYEAHGWQPVPLLVHARRAGCDGIARFTERNSVSGLIGTMPSHAMMPVLLAAAGRLAKFGA